ncbi:ABC transporter, ATP-binding component [Chlamydia abortus]|nr:ABC transporter, ATP-binding component [Chlamydia abortus]
MIRNINIFINYIFVVVQGIMTTTFISFNIARGVRSSKKLFEVLDTKTSIPFVTSDKKIVKGNIVFKDVTFAYEDKNIIEHISFEIKPGETLGIIGPTGSGKSTITNLINRDYLTKHGQILIDGNDISELDTISLVTNISYVYQVPALINASIKENLLFANANATEEDIERATKAACAYDFINKFPQKFDYVLEPKATNLSGGQKQRLSVAQGLIKHPKILMLDDFTSALDAKTEAKVKAKINEQFKDTTKIIISQKISAIKDATKILVMHHGKLDGYGTHEQLLKTNKLYKEIADVQQESVGGK